jgi:hypothetical protein
MKHQHKERMIIGLVLMISILISALSSAQVGESSIKGHVTEFGSIKPIKGAKIKYKLADSEDYKWGMITNEDGYFSTPNRFPDGMILKLVVSAKGYQQEYEEVITNEKNAVEINISLKKSSNSQMEFVKKDFTIQYREPREIYQLIEPYVSRTLRHAFSEQLRTISVEGTPEQLMLIDEVIQKYDTPLKQIWLEVSLIQATGNGKSKPEYPKELKNIVSKLQNLFKFGKYEIVGRSEAMGLEGSHIKFGTKRHQSKEGRVYIFEASSEIGYSNNIIRLENLSVFVVQPISNQLSTSINIKNGDTVILGSSRGGSQEGAIITVVTAKVMN